ncbi:MAG: transcriptional regulator, GntR family [Frankiales bacterium]|nr:transcriptional regulator, GntR family [Frankiales bacterium]
MLTASDHAAAYMRRLIFEGELRPDSRIPQDQVALALGISRIPVREALIALASEGYVTIAAHRGAFVNAFTDEDVADHFELRGHTRAVLARRAAVRRDPELPGRLAMVVSRMRETDDPDAFLAMSEESQRLLWEVGGSSRLQSAFDRFSNFVPGNYYAVIPGAVALGRDWSAREAAAQRDYDPDAAVRAAVESSVAYGTEVIRFLRSRGQLAAVETASPGWPVRIG